MKAFIIAAIVLAASSTAMATRIVPGGLNASLDTGSLAGTRFPVSFSYDADQVSPIGDSFVGLNSFNFTLLNVSFTQDNILQGGQVIFRNGLLDNVTASFQGPSLPPQSPVENITFGFGGPGVIGYIDLNGQFAVGSFTFVSTAVSEPISAYSLGLGLVTLFGFRVRRKMNRSLRQAR
jgi:hypothetical protein